MANKFFIVFRPGRKGPRAFSLKENKPVFPDRRWGTHQPQAGEGWEVVVAGENPGKTCYFVKPVRGPFPALSSKGDTRHLAALDAAIKDGSAVLAGETTVRGQSPERLYVLLDLGTYEEVLLRSLQRDERYLQACDDLGLAPTDPRSYKVVRSMWYGPLRRKELLGLGADEATHLIRGRGYEYSYLTRMWEK